MRIYYREAQLCGANTGNGDKLPWLKRWRYKWSSERQRQPFSLAQIEQVLFNKHHSIGCSIKAPLRYVSWQYYDQWYSISDGVRAYLPACICFTEGEKCYAIVIIEGRYELRVWRDSHVVQKQASQWFSHQPIVDEKQLTKLKESFDVLLMHIEQQNNQPSPI